jgi:large repetitive protein
VVSFDPKSGPTTGGTTVRVTVSDFGDLTSARVKFGSYAPVSPSGVSDTWIDVVTPPAAAPGAAGITVTRGVFSAAADTTFAYQAAPVTVVPSTGTICGNTKVTLTGSGFTSRLAVRFGSSPALSVRFIGATSAEATTPAVGEGIGKVSVFVSVDGGTTFMEMPNAFEFTDARPAFKRGDVNGSGGLDASDVVVISGIVSGSNPLPANPDAADVNDDGKIDAGDVIALTAFMFQGKGTIPPPFATAGKDPTPDAIDGCGL